MCPARAARSRPRVLGTFCGRPTWAAAERDRGCGEAALGAAGEFVLTTPADTEQAARELLAAGVDIHSAVYATTPAAAGDVAALFLHRRPAAVRLREGEVMDIDEEAFRENRVSARLYGYMSVPYARGLTQSAKAGGVAGEERALNDVATEVIRDMSPGALYILGPGTTTRMIMTRLGLEKTLLGVDAVRDGALAGRDVTEEDLLRLLQTHSEARIVVTVIGGQGHIFGRGNQQISPAVIRRVGTAAIIVIATQTKLLSLEGRPLLVDTGDPALDAELCGYAKVVTGLGERTMYKVGV